MKEQIMGEVSGLLSLCLNRMGGDAAFPFDLTQMAGASRILRLYGHVPTPLHDLPALVKRLGLQKILVKDESLVLGLPAFKARGVFNAMASLADSCQKLFVAATDGNHGLALATAARRMGHVARIFMPKGSPVRIQQAIGECEAICEITEWNYDDTVRFASDFAQKENGILVQDTAWSGYEQIPALIMAGYGTMAAEILETGARPTHVFLQAGVGSFASAFIAAYVMHAGEQSLPRFICVEPEASACVFKSICAADGKSHPVKGELATFMNGLACGEQSSLAWPILRGHLFAACSCVDSLARRGMELLANPQGKDPAIDSGPSGAVPIGALEYLSQSMESRARLGLDDNSTVLLINTEGSRFFR